MVFLKKKVRNGRNVALQTHHCICLCPEAKSHRHCSSHSVECLVGKVTKKHPSLWNNRSCAACGQNNALGSQVKRGGFTYHHPSDVLLKPGSTQMKYVYDDMCNIIIIIQKAPVLFLDQSLYHFCKWLVSAGHLCDLQGLFSETDNLCRVNRNEVQLLS